MDHRVVPTSLKAFKLQANSGDECIDKLIPSLEIGLSIG
jgi:hypothetical protein